MLVPAFREQDTVGIGVLRGGCEGLVCVGFGVLVFVGFLFGFFVGVGGGVSVGGTGVSVGGEVMVILTMLLKRLFRL